MHIVIWRISFPSHFFPSTLNHDHQIYHNYHKTPFCCYLQIHLGHLQLILLWSKSRPTCSNFFVLNYQYYFITLQISNWFNLNQELKSRIYSLTAISSFTLILLSVSPLPETFSLTTPPTPTISSYYAHSLVLQFLYFITILVPFLSLRILRNQLQVGLDRPRYHWKTLNTLVDNRQDKNNYWRLFCSCCCQPP